MKKIIIVGILLSMIVLLPIISVLSYFTPSQGDEVGTYRCLINDELLNASLTDDEMNDLKLLTDDVYRKEVILIYQFEKESKALSEIVTEVNTIQSVAKTNEQELTPSIVIQTHKYGVSYLESLKELNVSDVSIEVNLMYENRMEIESENSVADYYVQVQSDGVRNYCEVGAGQLPVSAPYEISGWFPSYNKDGTGGYHDGIDFALAIGTPVYATNAGTVVLTASGCANNGSLGNNCGQYGDNNMNGIGGLGNFVIIKVEGQDIFLAYAHLTSPLVSIGDTVSANQQIGLSGHSGKSTGPHLHFVVARSDNMYDVVNSMKVINPCDYVQGLCQ